MNFRLFVMLAVLFTILSPAARGLQSGGAWQVVPSPNTGSPHNHLYGVAAIASDDVWAVGAYGIFETEGARQVIQHWDGTRWSLVASPVPDERSQLLAVSAVDAQDVWAVGGYDTGGQALVEHWDGTAWSVVSHPNPAGFNRFHGVAARASDDVWAVGLQDDGGLQKTLAEHWDGSSWTVVPSPNIPSQHNQLHAVSAVPDSPNEVWAVGSAGPSALIMRWNGAQWSLVPSPSAGFNPRLNGVVAISANDVWAVGYTGGSSGTITLTMHWNGSTWSVVPSPNPGSTFNYLWGVGAAASNDVWAVGDSNEGGDGKTLILKWNGTAWVQVPGDTSGPSGLAFTLSAVSAISGSDVWSVGTNSHALAEHWNGVQWSIVAAPNAGVGNNVLKAVGGSAANDVWEVGYFVFGTEHRTLIEHWDGASWSIVPSPNTDKRLNELDGVVALSPTDAWAVGNAHSGDVLDQTTLILHWDGSSWSIVPSPSPGPAFNALRGISANAADDIWAVGGFGDTFGPFKVLIEHWDGEAWTVVPGVNLPATNNEFYGVGALAANDVWAVGYHGAFTFSPLIEHWNGSTWSIVPSPDPPLSSNVLRGVSGSGASDVWAVGTAKNLLTNIEGTLTEHWDGNQWNLAFGVNGPFSSLYGTAAASPDDAWQVGDLGGLALIGHWDGETWDIVPIPEVEGRLFAATTITPCDVWAVGQRSGPELGLLETLSMHFTLDCGATVQTLPGCFGNPAALAALSSAASIGGTFSVSLSSIQVATGLGLLYFGLDGTDAAGCGVLAPGLGELLLGLAPAPQPLGSSSLTSGTVGFTLPVPAAPALVGVEIALQGVALGVFDPGIPIELSNALLVTITQ